MMYDEEIKARGKMKITNKELAEDFENVLFDLTNGEVYEAMKYLGDIITALKKEGKWAKKHTD